MKLCKNCKHYRRMHFGPVESVDVCLMRSSPSKIDYVEGGEVYRYNSVISVQDEREDSTGIFGLFKDEDRCGTEAKNFEER